MRSKTRAGNLASRWVFASARRRRRSFWERLSPPQLFLGSFALLIALGTLGLRFLPGIYAEGQEPLSWIDALFTATSASCVTGLIVADTATRFTTAGQAWILLLIQLGGLGIITFTTLIMAALGRRLSLRHEAITASAVEATPHLDYRRLTVDVVRFTLAFEAIGAAALYILWTPQIGWTGAAWPAVFHSVSAFCNAGFSTFSDNMIGFQDAPATLLVISSLIIIGGIGFLTLEELYLRLQARRRRRVYRLSLHSRLVLTVTALVLLAGWVLSALLEWDVTLSGMPIGRKLVNAWFLSATPRTAGFNNIDYAQATDGTNFLTVILMSIGGSPGSTAGGLKTTTVALPALLLWARLRGREVTSLWGRTIPEETIQRAVGLAVGTFVLVTGSIFLMVSVELAGVAHQESQGGLLKHMFEAASAFNTVGLSMFTIEETAELSALSKLTLVALMYLGRVGLPTAAAALTLMAPTSAREFRFAYEDVVVG